MTKEELKQHCEKQVRMCEEWAKGNDREPSGKIYEEHKLILDLINALEQQPTTQEILSHIETGITATGQSDSYCVGFCNALVWLKSCITHEEPQYFEDGKKGMGINDN